MITEIQDKNCNGWAVISKDKLVNDGGCNLHIAEVVITKDINGNLVASHFNNAKKACCGRDIKSTATPNTQCMAIEGADSKFRTNLANWQNQGYELCGGCVGHFYKDPK